MSKKPVVASYCTTFLKPEMLHIYRQVTGLKRVDTLVICKERQSEERFPFPDVRMHRKVRSNFLRRFWLKYIKKEPPIVYRGEYGALRSILEPSGADLMHVYFGHTGVHLLPIIKRWPKPTVVSFHGMDVQPRENQPGYLDNLRDLLQTVPLVMVRSASLKARLLELGCPEAKIRMNRTSIPTGDFPKIDRPTPGTGEKDGWHLVQACRLIEKKGLDLTLRVFHTFLKSHPNARLTIAGDGPLEGELRAQAESLRIADRVRFAGFVKSSELKELYHEAHLFIHPSRLTADQNQEGVPNSMLEAMSTGLPVLATRHGGIPEAVDEEETGLLCDEDDET
ncbi:MAG: glycosyltransferase, partial [Verrucomicrobiae bacterium]|nr:glycosyltransferase [Verrucomicrobiae bacterium]